MKNTARLIATGLVTLSAMFASACHTVEGVGKDLESAGDKAEEVTRN